jgi:hypothetical protein
MNREDRDALLASMTAEQLDAYLEARRRQLREDLEANLHELQAMERGIKAAYAASIGLTFPVEWTEEVQAKIDALERRCKPEDGPYWGPR